MASVLITGASRGIGLEFVRQYGAAGWEVIAGARAPEGAAELRALAAGSAGRITVHPLDVADFGAIDALARQLDARAVDVLISCAGLLDRRGGFGASDFAEWERMFRVNALAPMKMAEAFVAHVARSTHKKIVSISSVMASMGRNAIGGYYAYRASKAALNAIVVSMALDLGRRHGISAAALHPGWVRTDMGGARADIDAATSVAGMRKVIEGLGRAESGRFWAYDGSELPW